MSFSTSLYENFKKAAGLFPFQEIIFPDEDLTFTYSSFLEYIDNVAAALSANSIGYDDKIAICGNNSSKWIALLFAANKIGAVIVPIITKATDDELCTILSSSKTKILFDLKYPEIEINPKTKNLKKIIKDYDFDLFVENKNISKNNVKEKSNPIYSIQYTSGTTSFMKGIVLKQEAVIKVAEIYAKNLELSKESVILFQLPLFYCFANVLVVQSFYNVGAKIIIPEKFHKDKCLKLIEKYKITDASGVPEMFLAMITSETINNCNITSLKNIAIGGSECSKMHAKMIAKAFDTENLIIGYGLTESTALSIVDSYKTSSFEKRCSSIGKLIEGVEGRIVEPDTLTILGDNRIGELQLKGFNILSEYYDSPETTKNAFTKDGWFKTGDLVIRDSEGFYSILGRIKDLIIRNGENISPQPIENSLSSFPKIKQAQVVGVLDEKYGERICAFILPENQNDLPKISDLKKHVSKELAKNRAPDFFICVKQFPQTANNKIEKKGLKELADRYRPKLKQNEWFIL